MKSEKIVAAVFLLAVLTGVQSINANEEQCILKPEYQKYCIEAGDKYGICPELLMAIAEQESAGDPDAVGQGGDTGLMQVVAKWHTGRMESLGVTDLTDPKSNILVAADYIAELAGKYEDPGTMLMVYNGTKDAVKRGESGDLTEYAEGILTRAAELERMDGK